MFDLPEDSVSASVDTEKISQLMQSLDVFINIRHKPKQSTLSVIIKGIERNAGNIYEARKQLLGLDEPRVHAEIPATYHIPNAGSIFQGNSDNDVGKCRDKSSSQIERAVRGRDNSASRIISRNEFAQVANIPVFRLQQSDERRRAGQLLEHVDHKHAKLAVLRVAHSSFAKSYGALAALGSASSSVHVLAAGNAPPVLLHSLEPPTDDATYAAQQYDASSPWHVEPCVSPQRVDQLSWYPRSEC